MASGRVPQGVEHNRPIRVDLALVHYPVVNKNGETIGSAITNLDLHDIARAAKTFGVDTLYVVTPYQDQQQLYQEILDHWLTGYGAGYNKKRGEALSLVRFCRSVEELFATVAAKWQERPLTLTTCARPQQVVMPYDQVREKVANGESLLVLFGTAWGLAPEVMASADGGLPSINGRGEYNHLSVRSAAAIVLDRIMGRHE